MLFLIKKNRESDNLLRTQRCFSIFIRGGLLMSRCQIFLKTFQNRLLTCNPRGWENRGRLVRINTWGLGRLWEDYEGSKRIRRQGRIRKDRIRKNRRGLGRIKEIRRVREGRLNGRALSGVLKGRGRWRRVRKGLWGRLGKQDFFFFNISSLSHTLLLSYKYCCVCFLCLNFQFWIPVRLWKVFPDCISPFVSPLHFNSFISHRKENYLICLFLFKCHSFILLFFFFLPLHIFAAVF